MRSLSGNNSEQCTGVFRDDDNQHGREKAQGLKPRSLLGLYGPTKELAEKVI